MADQMVSIKSSDELEFVIFCVENIAERLGISATEAYDRLRSNDVLNGYIVPEYEILHTQGKEYIIDDILEVMKERGASL